MGLATANPPHSQVTIASPIHGSAENRLVITVAAQKLIWPQGSIPFHPYYTVKDLFGVGVFMIVFAAFVFFMPNALGEPDNYIRANPMVTPSHIVPEWYFLPYYAILRAIPDKLLGVIGMFGSISILLVLPWIDRSPVRSGRFRSIYFKFFFWVFVVDCIFLGWIGANSPDDVVAGITFLTLGRFGTAYYFMYFVIVFVVSIVETPKPMTKYMK